MVPFGLLILFVLAIMGGIADMPWLSAISLVIVVVPFLIYLIIDLFSKETE